MKTHLLLIAATVFTFEYCLGLSVQPGATVGVVGKGFISILTAKLAAINGYNAWVAIPPGEEEAVKTLIYENPNDDEKLPIKLISSMESEAIEASLSTSDAVILASDDSNTPLAESVVNFVLQPELCSQLKRIVFMSRNLNNQGYGFFVKASKMSSNGEVWAPDANLIKQFRGVEDLIKKRAKEIGFDYTIARAGTLKGGACGEVDGEDYCPQFLASKYYEVTKKDIVTWQFLFDCQSRGVVLEKGDVLPGPGNKAVFTASAPEPSVGDTSRGGIAGAMIECIARENSANCDFGIGASASRSPPTSSEWDNLFAVL